MQGTKDMVKILIVDDSESLRTQLKRALEEAHYEVVEGTNGLNGLETLKANPEVRLILCDVNMPKMDGLSMCRKVRETYPDLRLPIIMITTESSPEMKATGKEIGVSAWIIKPFIEIKLISAIKKLLASGAEA